MSYDFRHIMWKKDNPTNNLVMTVSEDNSETKKKKRQSKTLHPSGEKLAP